MPSSMIFFSLVVVWLLILVPAIARHRHEVARPSVAALSGRVLERPRRRQNLEVDVTDTERSHDRTIDVAERPGRAQPRVPAARTVEAPSPAAATPPPDGRSEADPGGDDTRPGEIRRDEIRRDETRRDETRDTGYADGEHDDEHDGDAEHDRGDQEHEHEFTEDHDESRRWDRPPPRYRPGRGGYDPEAAVMTARARYTFRQRAVLVMLVGALITGVVAVAAVPGVWWLHAAIDIGLVGYLGYLRRQVRLEEAIRDRRSARMAGARRRPAADDPELDGWARRGQDATVGREEAVEDTREEDEHAADRDELEREQPERISGTGASLRSATELVDPVEEIALPRLQPVPTPAMPAGTSLVEADDDDPTHHQLDALSRPYYRRAAGQ